MGEGETVGALGDFDFQAVVWGGGDALDALSGADFEHFAASRMDLLSAGRKMVASSTPLMMALEKTYQVNRGA